METPDQSSLIDQVRQLIKPEYHAVIPLFLSNANKSELKGLKLISLVIANQGLKKFKPPKKLVIGESSISSKNLNKIQSSYTEAFGENVSQKVFESEVLKCVKLSALKISRPLKPEVLMFLERWVQVEETDHYLNLMLNFLRAFYSVSIVNTAVPMSTTRELFSRKKVERGQRYGRKKFYNEDVRVKLPEINRYKSLEVLKPNHAIVKDVKEFVNRDHNDMIKWVTGINPFKTMYQDTFHAKSFQTILPARKDFYTSTSIKLLPDFTK